MKMRTIDWLRLKYGLMWKKAPVVLVIEWAVMALSFVLLCFFLVNLLWSVYQMMQYNHEAKATIDAQYVKINTLETSLVNCLNGNIVGHAGGETIACDGATHFRM